MTPTRWILLAAGTALLINGLVILALRRRRAGQSILPRWATRPLAAIQDNQGLIFAATLLAAALPFILVIQDRWLGDWRDVAILASPWCDLGLFCETFGGLPLSFPWMILSLGAAFILAGRQKQVIFPWLGSAGPGGQSARQDMTAGRHQVRVGNVIVAASAVSLLTLGAAGLLAGRPPEYGYAVSILALLAGLSLREYPLRRLRGFWAANGGWFLAALLVHLALVAVLARIYSAGGVPWPFAGALALTLLNALRHRRRIPAVFWIISLALVLFTWELNAWWFSIVGDEYEFFRFAREIAQEYSIPGMGPLLFQGQGVYGVHPVFSSLIQAASMKLFGPINFGWRISNLYLAALAVGFFYSFLRAFTSRPLALLGATFLAASHYLMAFGKIGYNNPQALLALAVALWAAARALRRPGAFWFAALGVALGGLFYVFPVAVFAIPVVLLLLWLYRRQVQLRPVHWAWMGTAAGFVLYPLLLQPEYWGNRLFGLFLGRPEITGSLGALAAHLARNSFFSLFGFVILPEETHFVSVSYADPVSGLFIALGLAWLVHHGRRERFGLFCLASYLLLLFLVGVSHDHPFPPATRMFVLLPWYGLLAALGLLWVGARAADLGVPRRLLRALLPALLLAVLAGNLYQAYHLSRERMPQYQSMQALLLRLMDETFTPSDETRTKIVILNEPQFLDMNLVHDMADLYQIPVEADRLKAIVPDGPRLGEPEAAAIRDPEAIVVLHYALPLDWQVGLADAMIALEKDRCDVRTTRGEFRFSVWYAGGRALPCAW